MLIVFLCEFNSTAIFASINKSIRSASRKRTILYRTSVARTTSTSALVASTRDAVRKRLTTRPSTSATKAPSFASVVAECTTQHTSSAVVAT